MTRPDDTTPDPRRSGELAWGDAEALEAGPDGAVLWTPERGLEVLP